MRLALGLSTSRSRLGSGSGGGSLITISAPDGAYTGATLIVVSLAAPAQYQFTIDGVTSGPLFDSPGTIPLVAPGSIIQVTDENGVVSNELIAIRIPDPLAGISFYFRAQSTLLEPGGTQQFLHLVGTGFDRKLYLDQAANKYIDSTGAYFIDYASSSWTFRDTIGQDYYTAVGTGDPFELDTLTWTLGASGSGDLPTVTYNTESKYLPFGVIDPASNPARDLFVPVAQIVDDYGAALNSQANLNPGFQRLLYYPNGIPDLYNDFSSTGVYSIPGAFNNVYECIISNFSGIEKFKIGHGPIGTSMPTLKTNQNTPNLYVGVLGTFSPEEETAIRNEALRITQYAQPGPTELYRLYSVTTSNKSLAFSGAGHGITYQVNDAAPFTPSLTQNVYLNKGDTIISRSTGKNNILTFTMNSQRLAGFCPNFKDCVKITAITMTNQQFIGNLTDKLVNTPLLSTISVTQCDLSGTINLSALPALTVCSMNNNRISGFEGTVSATLGNCNLSGNIMTQAAVDACLQAFVDAGRVAGTRVLNLGGLATNMAIPSSAGLANKAILQGRGWTVTTR